MILEIKQNNFSGGISEDKRVQDWTKFSVSKNFDAFTYPRKLVPYAKMEDSFDDVSTYEIRKVIYAPYTAGNYRLFGFGVVAGTTRAKIFDLVPTGNLDATAWNPTTNGEATEAARDTNVFFYYKGFIYYWRASRYLARFDVTISVAIDESYKDVTSFANVAQPVHHPSDDVAYFFHDNIVDKLNNTTWTSNALVLPTNLKIVSACPYGNYLAIGCVTVGYSADIRSIVYLWDRDSSITTLTERIDFGEGSLAHLANLNNKLIGVINFYANSSLGSNNSKILIKQASGQFALQLNEITVDTTTGTPLPRTSYVRNNVLYFPMIAQLDGDTREGIWGVNENGKVTLEIGQDAITAILGIYATGNLWWVAFYSGAYKLYHIDDDSAYSTTIPAVFETLIINGGDSAKTKKLLAVSVSTEPLPATASIVLKYRINEETSWTTIFTNTTDNSISHSSVNIEATGVNLPEFKELQLRIESLGGAILTGWKAKMETISKDIYD